MKCKVEECYYKRTGELLPCEECLIQGTEEREENRNDE